MDRRSVLRRFGSCTILATAGCIERFGDDTPLNESSTSDEPPDSARRKIDIVNFDGNPDDVPITIRVWVERPWITTDRTAELTLWYKNDGSLTHEYQQPFYKGASSWLGDPGLLLYDVDAPAPVAGEPPACWGTEQPSKDSLAWTTETPPGTELVPTEERSTRLIVADDPSVAGCFPPGRYQFGRKVGVDKMSFEWSFTVEVTDVTNGP